MRDSLLVLGLSKVVASQTVKLRGPNSNCAQGMESPDRTIGNQLTIHHWKGRIPMKKTLWTAIAALTTALNGWAAASVTVNQSGSGNFTNIQAAIDSGATTITITDRGQYLENLQIPAGPA